MLAGNTLGLALDTRDWRSTMRGRVAELAVRRRGRPRFGRKSVLQAWVYAHESSGANSGNILGGAAHIRRSSTYMAPIWKAFRRKSAQSIVFAATELILGDARRPGSVGATLRTGLESARVWSRDVCQHRTRCRKMRARAPRARAKSVPVPLASDELYPGLSSHSRLSG